MTAPLDPSSIETWEDAFQYPIPQVRQLERQLRADLGTNKEKLRGLVGESYRDLLQTAERIIEMESVAHKVEENLGEASKNCNYRLVERKARNLKDFQEKVGANDHEKFIFAARLAVLQACPSVLSRLLHKDKGETCLLAGKVFVISRLLSRSFGENNAIPLLEPSRAQLATFRPVLLQHVDSLISSNTLTTPTLISALTAFSILSTSPSTEVLRHFLKIRSTKLSSLLPEDTAPDADTILKSVAVYNQSIEDADTIFPKNLGDSLISLKSKSLLEQSDVLGVPDLSLDVHGRWLPDDIRGFIPWVRHDDLEVSKVREMVSKWAGEEVKKLNQNLEKAVGAMNDVDEIIKLRADVLRLWRSGWKIRQKYLSGGEEFRKIVMDRVNSTMRIEVNVLKDVGQKIGSLLGEVDKEDTDSTSLWSESLLSLDFRNGATAFREAVSGRVHGKSDAIRSFLEDYNTWLEKITRTAIIIRELRSTSPQPEDEDEDFDTEEERIQESTEDSEMAEKGLLAALDEAYHKLETTFSSFVENLQPEGPSTVGSLAQETFLLRSIRQIRQLPAKRNDDVLVSLSWFGLTIIPKLHLVIAQEVCKTPLETISRHLESRKWEDPVVSKPLWEGSPALPVQPSPLVFRFLHDLVTTMGKAGEDVWTPAAVKCVKTVACDNIWKALAPVLEAREYFDKDNPATPNGDVTPRPIFIAGNSRRSSMHSLSRRSSVQSNREDMAPSSPTLAQTPILARPPTPAQAQAQTKAQAQAPALNGTAPDNENSSPKTNGVDVRQKITKDWTIQLLFDSLYLDEALHRRRRRGGNGGTSVASLAAKVDAVVAPKMHLDEELRMRLESSSSEYWKRTCLLFAFLGGN
ncbi:hypothetical protein EDC01DRAFT_497941 [Geopyxis carbonaria]|nr:hypothetical protein EDC01DRAFT_497941 [Geopyxis carbonaria]